MTPLEPAVPLLTPVDVNANSTPIESQRILNMLKKSADVTNKRSNLVISAGDSPLTRASSGSSPMSFSKPSIGGMNGMSIMQTVLREKNGPRLHRDGHYNVDASTDLLRMIQPHKSHKSVPFIPHNAYSIDPITGGMIAPIARDLIPQGLPMNRIPTGMWGCIQQSSNIPMNIADDEEAHGLSGFDRVLYTRSEQARRSACDEYSYVCRQKGTDLTISMPIQVPYGSIIVDVNSGEHYYGIVGENARPDHPHSDHILFGRGLKADKTMSHRSETNDDEITEGIPDFTASHHPSACDVWSSFLHIKLGVIYNVRDDQFRIVTETLKQIMKGATFERPIEFTANGIYCNGPQGILQSPPETSRGAKYVTHLKPKTTGDQERFIMLRRRIKTFANALGFHFGGSIGGISSFSNGTEYQPPICVELDANLSSERVRNGLIQVDIRSYNAEIIDAKLKDDIWTPIQDQPSTYRNSTKDTIVSKVEATEIRLEHDRGHTVDPRWPKELVVARRIASYDTVNGSDHVVADRFARHVFSTRMSPQTIIYNGSFRDLEADEVPKFTTDKKLDGKVVTERLCTSRFKREFLGYLRCEPNAGTSTAVDGVNISPVNAPLPMPYVPVVAPPVSTPSLGGSLNWNVNATEFRPSRGQFTKKKGPNNTKGKKKAPYKKGNTTNTKPSNKPVTAKE